MHKNYRNIKIAAATAVLIASCLVMVACTPTVRVEAPKEPITINLNIKLDADVRVKLEEQAKQDVASKPDVF
ncbi:MAG TPA: YnbE family lipoprotein [Chromatiales bacterium]|nr:YnbE family lipoprotein [Thiotrichales bacterium]HIP68452.1 YnbE family lipoprotein [Chromatiales bacterium]